MKRILILFFIVGSVSCTMHESNSNPDSINETPSEPLPETDTPEPETPSSSPVVLALYDGTDLNFYDGAGFSEGYSGIDFEYAGNRKAAVSDIYNIYDEYGAVTASCQLPGIPSHLLTTSASSQGRAAIDGEDVYTFETIDPDTAQSMGALKRTYTRIFKNYTEYGNWYLNEYEVENVYEVNSKIIIEDSAGALVNLSTSEDPYKVGSDFLITNIDFTNRKADFNGVEVGFNQNYFYTSKWQKCGDNFQSQHGLVFDGSILTEGATSLQDFISMEHPTGEKYSLWPSGTRTENSESVSYWIDSTSGWLIRYVPSIDSYGMPVRLFVGPMDYSTGNTLASDINPQWIEDKLYFHWSGSVYVYDPSFGSVGVFSDDMEVLEW